MRREFLIGGHERGGDIMCQEVRVGGHVQELDDILVTNDAATACFWEGLGRDDLPMVVRVIMAVPGDLLTYRSMSEKQSKCAKGKYTP
jgi:hypothetical protein